VGRGGYWVGLEGRVGVDSLGILVLGFEREKASNQKEFKFEFELQQPK
jgi:hypothetical protein